MQAELNEIRSRMDAYERAQVEGPRWHRHILGIISAMAALVSVIGSAVSVYTARQGELQAAHAEVREIVQKLGRLPREQFELQQRFATNTAAMSSVSGLINSENKVLAKRGHELIKRIPGLVSAAERIYIGNALLASSLYEEARVQFQAAVQDGTELEDLVTARRFLAQVHYTLGAPELGQVEMATAKREVEGRIQSGYSMAHGEFLNVGTEVRWASFEAAARNCARYDEHARAAQVHLQRDPEWGRPPLAMEINTLLGMGCPQGVKSAQGAR